MTQTDDVFDSHLISIDQPLWNLPLFSPCFDFILFINRIILYFHLCKALMFYALNIQNSLCLAWLLYWYIIVASLHNSFISHHSSDIPEIDCLTVWHSFTPRFIKFISHIHVASVIIAASFTSLTPILVDICCFSSTSQTCQKQKEGKKSFCMLFPRCEKQ